MIHFKDAAGNILQSFPGEMIEVTAGGESVLIDVANSRVTLGGVQFHVKDSFVTMENNGNTAAVLQFNGSKVYLGDSAKAISLNFADKPALGEAKDADSYRIAKVEGALGWIGAKAGS